MGHNIAVTRIPADVIVLAEMEAVWNITDGANHRCFGNGCVVAGIDTGQRYEHYNDRGA